MSEDIERIELKIAYLEKANAELSDVVYRQQREIELLNLKIEGLQGRLDSLPDAGPVLTPEDERPPHY